MDRKLFFVKKDNTLLDALKKLDANNKGFLVVTDDDYHLKGVLTDGDVRRSLISGVQILDKVERSYQNNPSYIEITESLLELINKFKDDKIKFLPIINENWEVVNIVTKRQMHAILLMNKYVGLDYDFFSVDENIIEYEVHSRPWGFYKTTVLNDFFQSKVISIEPMGKLSLQKHKFREEYWTIVHGMGEVTIEDSVKQVCVGSFVFIPKGSKHRIINTQCNDTLILTEIQIGSYLGEDDIIRIDDCYGRKSGVVEK